MSKLTIFFFRNACTKSGQLQFSQFSVPSDCVCLLTYEFCLFLLEDCSVFGSLLLPLYIKGVSIIHISKKNRQHNGQKKKVQKDKQRSTKHTHKTKDQVKRTPLNTGGELMCSGRVSSSCSISSTRRVNLITN